MADMRVWVGCLGCYNDGLLIGEWVDAVDAESVTVGRLAETMREGSQTRAWHLTHEELWVMDLDGMAPFVTGECSPAHAQRVAEMVGQVAEHQRGAFGAWFENESRDLDDDLPGQFEEEYRGEYDSLTDYAATYCEDAGMTQSLPEWVANYVDYEAMGRDWRLGGDIWEAATPDGGVWVFTNA